MPSPELDATMPTQTSPATSQSPAPGKDATRIADLLASLWQRSLPEITVRLSVLDRAATAANHGELTVELRREAASVAHKLSGSLGMYGHGQASKCAQQIEGMLEAQEAVDPVGLGEHTLRLRQAIPL